MEREEEEEEEKVFVCSLAYSTLMDSSGTTDQDEKTSIEEASTSGASSGSGSESPGSPTPLVGERVVDVSEKGLSFTNVKHSPLFRTRLPHLSAHSLALTAGNRKQRYRSPYVPSGQYAQPQSYDKWSRQRSKTSKWTRRRRLERPLLWLATAILILLLIAGIMIAVFWVSGSGSDKDGKGGMVLLPNATNTTTTTAIPGPGVIITNLSMTSLPNVTSLPTSPTHSTSPPSTTPLKTTTSTTKVTSPSTTTSSTTTTTTTTPLTSTLKATVSTTTLSPSTATTRTTIKAVNEIFSSPTTRSSTPSQGSTVAAQPATIAVYIVTDKPRQNTTATPASNTLPSNVVPAVPAVADTNNTPAGDLSQTDNRNTTEKPP